MPHLPGPRRPTGTDRLTWAILTPAGATRSVMASARSRSGPDRSLAERDTVGTDRRRLEGRTRMRLWGESLALGTVAAGLVGLALTGPASAVEVGQKAPDFALAAPGGKQVTLADLTAQGPVVIYTFIQVFGGV